MKLKKVKLTNFFSYKSCEINLDNSKVTLIEGKKNNSDASSNGAGKSTIFQAIYFAMYGDIRGRKAGEIIFFGEKQASVDLFFILGRKQYKITRIRRETGSSNAWIFVKDKEKWKDISGQTMAETNRLILTLIGISKDIFQSSVFFEENAISAFADRKSAGRLELIKSILNLGDYEICKKIASKKLASKEKDLDDKLLLIDENKSIINDIESHKESMKNSNLSIKSISREIKTLEEGKFLLEKNSPSDLIFKKKSIEENLDRVLLDISDNESRILNLDTKLTSVASQLKEYEDDHNKYKTEYLSLSQAVAVVDIEKISNDISSMDSKLSTILASRQSLINDKFSSQGEKKVRVGEINSVSTLGADCPTCFRPISDEDKNKIVQARKIVVASLDASIQKIDDESQKMSLVIGDLESIITTRKADSKLVLDQTSRLENLKNLLINIKKSSQLLDTSDIKEEIKDRDVKMIDLKKDLLRLELELKSIGDVSDTSVEIDKISNNLVLKQNEKTDLVRQNGRLEYIISEKEDILRSVKMAKKDAKALGEDIEHYKILEYSFGKNGIPSEIIKSTLEDVEKETNKMLSSFSSDIANIEFCTDRSTYFDIFASFFGQRRRFETFSNGQKCRISFCIRFALAKIVAKHSKSHIKFVMIDEAVGSFDEEGVESMGDMLKTLSKEYRIFVISHKKDLQDILGDRILVAQTNGISSIEQC